MFEFANYPVIFWVSLLLVFTLIFIGWQSLEKGWGIPAITLSGTVLLWYHGDAIYNDYTNHHTQLFDHLTLNNAWFQVCIFTVAFGFLLPTLHNLINQDYQLRTSNAFSLLTKGTAIARIQPYLSNTFRAVILGWSVTTATGLLRTKLDALAYFFPYIAGYKVYPWARGRLGSGLDAILSLFHYLDLFSCSAIGLIAVLTNKTSIRLTCLTLMLLAWPSQLFERNRNTILAVVLPTVLALVFMRLRGRIYLQLALISLALFGFDSWFRFVLANRGSQSLVEAINNEEAQVAKKHEGLNMFEELAWIDKLSNNGEYAPNFGQRYFAELCNPIPRSLWPNKPLVGIDYAIARGFAGNSADGGVTTTISTGMIGQGVVNFGPYLGPFAAALLASLWCCMLARFDLTPEKPGRLILFGIGIILTFNMGRDITLLVAYPIIFGYLIFEGHARFFANRQFDIRQR